MAYCILKSYKLSFDTFSLFRALANHRNCFFLDSSLNFRPSGRFSFLGAEPFEKIETKGIDPFPRIRKELGKYKLPPNPDIPFLGGAVGYFAYDLGFSLEDKLKSRRKADEMLPDCFLGLYNTVIAVDHLKKIFYISVLGFPERKQHYAKLLCEKNFKKISKIISNVGSSGSNKENKNKRASGELNSNFKKHEYLNAVKKAREYIRQGDIYQVNLSQKFSGKTDLSDVEIYNKLRHASPSCFGGFFDTGNFKILSSSPERFLSFDGKKVVTQPMKGTRPRGENKSRDTKLRQELLSSKKDQAELVMIVDLERNDLGKVCHYESIKVTNIRQLEKYSTVYQTTSTIEGRLYKNKDMVDLLRACFPGGSITGCPKIRAMEIIDELEPDARQAYTGALGYISFNQNMDFNILIRSILKRDKQFSFSVGGGIVYDSLPEKEYEETLIKAKGMLEAIR